MRKSFLNFFLFAGLIVAGLIGCVDERYRTIAPLIDDQSYVEEFDTVASALARGWEIKNTSIPKGSNVWQQAGHVVPWFSPHSSNGTYAGFIGADYTSTSAATGIISNWLISPAVTMQNGDKIIFYTRALQYFDGVNDTTDFGNRLQLRLNIHNGELNVGSGTSTGDFETNLLDINPGYDFSSVLTPAPNAYPSNWTRFEATITGLPKPVKGRYAFRYFIEGGGFNGLGSGVAIDYVTYKSVTQ